jgi:hypothetical protein
MEMVKTLREWWNKATTTKKLMLGGVILADVLVFVKLYKVYTPQISTIVKTPA